MTKKYLLFVFVLLVITLYLQRNIIFLELGKFLFLNLHQNTLAIKTLENIDFINFEILPEKYFLLGRIYFVENQLGLSVQKYSKALDYNPDYKEAYYGRGLSFGFLSPLYYENARQDFEKYIFLENLEFTQTGKHAFGAWAGYNDLAWIYFMQNDLENAKKTTLAGLEFSNMNPWLLNTLGAILSEQGECEQAKENLNLAKLILPNITPSEFGEAYSGDSPNNFQMGKEIMKKTIEENIHKCSG